MRTKLVNNRWLLCGCILPVEAIKVGQEWASGSGTVTIVAVDDDGWVTYSWEERGELRRWNKESFAFQCRYCLVLPTPEIPPELKGNHEPETSPDRAGA